MHALVNGAAPFEPLLASDTTSLAAGCVVGRYARVASGFAYDAERISPRDYHTGQQRLPAEAEEREVAQFIAETQIKVS